MPTRFAVMTLVILAGVVLTGIVEAASHRRLCRERARLL